MSGTRADPEICFWGLPSGPKAPILDAECVESETAKSLLLLLGGPEERRKLPHRCTAAAEIEFGKI